VVQPIADAGTAKNVLIVRFENGKRYRIGDLHRSFEMSVETEKSDFAQQNKQTVSFLFLCV
jgi:hypothetical protein